MDFETKYEKTSVIHWAEARASQNNYVVTCNAGELDGEARICVARDVSSAFQGKLASKPAAPLASCGQLALHN